METTIDDLLTKVRIIAETPSGALLRQLVDLIYEKIETEYDTEPLSPEELAAIEETEDAIRRGDLSRFISLEEFEKELGL